MRIPRLFVDADLVPGDTVALPEQSGEHVARVLRLGIGHTVILFNGDGAEYDARLASLAKRAVLAEIDARRDISRESPLALTLVQGIARGEKMDWILQKATELGVARLVPIVTERTEVRLDEDRAGRRLAHWRQVIVSACEQCGRTRLPALEPPQLLTTWLAAERDAAAGVSGSPLRLALLPEGDTTLRRIEWRNGAATLAVGPEGGFSSRDENALRHAGFLGLRLGPRILRTETAGIAALAALQALGGDLSA